MIRGGWWAERISWRRNLDSRENKGERKGDSRSQTWREQESRPYRMKEK